MLSCSMMKFESNNVKQYFVHALKSLGLRDDQPNAAGAFSELAEAEILQLLDDPQTTPSMIYDRLKFAILQQLQNDAKGEKYLQERTRFDRQTVKNMLLTQPAIDKFKFANKVADTFLRHVSASGVSENGNINLKQGGLDAIVETVIMTMVSGLLNQKLKDSQDASQDEKSQATTIWDEIRYAKFKEELSSTNQYQEAKFKAWLEDETTSPDYSKLYRVYQQDHAQQALLSEMVARCGSETTARKLLATKVQGETLQWLAANGHLLEESREYCVKRCQIAGINPDPEKELTLADVLAVAGNAKTQVVTFFQTRANEQKREPQKTELKKENKIGNTMGAAGREFIKTVTGAGIAVDYDIESLKEPKAGPWRGFKKIYDKISSYMGSIYNSIQSIGLVNIMMERLGYPSTTSDYVGNMEEETDPQKLKEQNEPWKTSYQAMPNVYKNPDGTLNIAGEFYNKTKARILADKTRIATASVLLRKVDDQTQKNTLNAQLGYLQQRVSVAEEILRFQMPEPNAANFNDAKYFAKLEMMILAEEENQNNTHVTSLIKNGKQQTANQEMAQALSAFHKMAKGNTLSTENAKREMAKDIFNLRDKAQAGKVSDSDLDGMTERLFASQNFFQMYAELNGLSTGNQQQKITAVDAMSALNQYTEKYLQQYVMNDQWEQYEINQHREAIVKDM